jgi:hypothetical protein
MVTNIPSLVTTLPAVVIPAITAPTFPAPITRPVLGLPSHPAQPLAQPPGLPAPPKPPTAANPQSPTLPSNTGGGAGDISRDHLVEVENLLSKSTCTKDDLYKYLRNIDSEAAELYLKTNKWPENVQIPKNPDVLNADGTIKWSEVPNNGYVLDSAGNAIREPYIPKIGEVIDRYGPSNGRFTSPVIDGKPFNYDQRSLPFIEDQSMYSQYRVKGDFNKIKEYVDNCSDIELKNQINAYMDIYYDGDFSIAMPYKGDIAPGFGGVKGGMQYQMPLSVDALEKLGLLEKI